VGKLITIQQRFTNRTIEQSLLSIEQNNERYLFTSLHFYLSREVPRESLEFVILSFGGQVSCESSSSESIESITHQIVDRPSQKHQHLNREYLQPQWVYDCVNVSYLIPGTQYYPGVKLPAHLSPFVNDEAEGYIPERRKELNILLGYAEEKSDDQPVEKTFEEKQVEMEENYKRDLEKDLGIQPLPALQIEKQIGAPSRDEDESRSLLLSNKKRRIYERMQSRKRIAVERNEKLETKKKKLAANKKDGS